MLAAACRACDAERHGNADDCVGVADVFQYGDAVLTVRLSATDAACAGDGYGGASATHDW